MDHLFKRGDTLRDHTRRIHTKNLTNSDIKRVRRDCTKLLKAKGGYTFRKKAKGSDEDVQPMLISHLVISVAKKRRRKFARSI